MAVQFAGNALRTGWFTGAGWLADRAAARTSAPPRLTPVRPVPSRAEITADVHALMRRDAEAAGEGLFPPLEDEAGGLAEHLRRLALMFANIPGTMSRRIARDAGTVRRLADGSGLPDYFIQDFHYQTGGYLSETSARLYDIQVETLFRGTANAMRRTVLRPVARFLRGTDQRRSALLDAGCGTGRLLRQIRLAFPALPLTGLDLSRPYLGEAGRHLAGLKPAALIAANVENIPLPNASQDIVTCVYLFHELPPDVRVRVTAEIVRVLAPGGLFVFLDSLQYGDRPGWDGLLETFPARFHEPYYESYLTHGLDAMFRDAGLVPEASWLAFLSKGQAWRKAP